MLCIHMYVHELVHVLSLSLSLSHLPPLHSAYHSLPLKLHLGGAGWDVMGIYEGTFKTPTPSLPSLSTLSTHHQGPMYDSIFVLSSGRVTSIGPQGEFNWQVCVCVIVHVHMCIIPYCPGQACPCHIYRIQGVNVAVSVQMYAIYIPGKHPCAPYYV